MKEEIKEILEYLKIENGTIGSELSYEETHLLLDYITNLQEENERLRAKKWQIKTLKEEWSEINENATLVFENNSLIEFMNKLENILQGEEK